MSSADESYVRSLGDDSRGRSSDPGIAVAPRPTPAPTEFSAGYWDAAARGHLAIQRCETCRTWNHPPSISCPDCGSTALRFEQVSGRGSIHQFAIARQSKLDGFESRVPYTIAAIELDEQSQLIVVANIVDAEPVEVGIGRRVRVTFEEAAGCTLPQFVLEATP